MTPLAALFVGFALVWAGLFLYVLRLLRISRALEAEVRALRQAHPPAGRTADR